MPDQPLVITIEDVAASLTRPTREALAALRGTDPDAPDWRIVLTWPNGGTTMNPDATAADVARYAAGRSQEENRNA